MTSMRDTNRERGIALIEILVALSVGLIVISAAFTLFLEDSRTCHTQTQITEMRQNARSVLESMARELRPAGFGMKDLPVSVDAVIADEPTQLTVASATAITIRANNQDVWSNLSDPMPQPSAELKVQSTVGFVDGMRVMIWDGSGTWDWLIITHVQTAASHLQHNTTSCSKAYAPPDTMIAAIEEIVYRWVPATLTVERQQDEGPWIPVATDIEAFRVRYADATGAPITPDTAALRRSIRKVSVWLRARTNQKDRRTGRYHTYTASTEVYLPNLPNLPQS